LASGGGGAIKLATMTTGVAAAGVSCRKPLCKAHNASAWAQTTATTMGVRRGGMVYGWVACVLGRASVLGAAVQVVGIV
jgi:hypothetical protein